MSQSDKYRDIYNKEIICKGRGIVVRKRADGRWESRIVVGHKEDGKRYTVRCLPRNKATLCQSSMS